MNAYKSDREYGYRSEGVYAGVSECTSECVMECVGA